MPQLPVGQFPSLARPLTLLLFMALASLDCSGPNEASPSAKNPAQPPPSGSAMHNEHSGHHPHDHKHGAPHRFENAEEWAKHFEGPERDAWQKPDQVVAALGLVPNQNLADIGAGTGYFAVRFASKAPQGKVFAIDIEPDMVRYMNDRAKKNNLSNLVPVLGAVDDAKIPEPVDIIFVCDTYHHIENRTAYFQKLAPKLTPKGTLVIVDFKAIETPVGPPLAMRLSPQQIDTELSAAGFARASLDESLLPYQYIVTYKKK